ncbi:MAG: hypothetical protein EZS28_028743 [Streblomastix strix]|uniref:RING-CH-type domain-containing protein n=1 Tax=Streblomastix strix TaxID=222440 RepID=A0A5J4V0Z4_9EUKA|nr:MAG: hypothetical protein EZS28_028743 [Streblomastix strix]
MSEEYECRICRTADPDLTLFRACNCKGSVGLVHLECLSEWIKYSASQNRIWKQCEICHTNFRIKDRTFPFYKWNKPLFSDYDITKLFVSIIIQLILAYAGFAALPISMYKEIIVSEMSFVDYTHQSQNGLFALFFIFLFFDFFRVYPSLVTKWKSQNMGLDVESQALIVMQNIPVRGLLGQNQSFGKKQVKKRLGFEYEEIQDEDDDEEDNEDEGNVSIEGNDEDEDVDQRERRKLTKTKNNGKKDNSYSQVQNEVFSHNILIHAEEEGRTQKHKEKPIIIKKDKK